MISMSMDESSALNSLEMISKVEEANSVSFLNQTPIFGS